LRERARSRWSAGHGLDGTDHLGAGRDGTWRGIGAAANKNLAGRIVHVRLGRSGVAAEEHGSHQAHQDHPGGRH
jgi:hypothetical protein